jgi:citrate lyase subunit beta/citryl-CoA lyase
LFGEGDGAAMVPVCDHDSGVEARRRNSLTQQAEWGPIFDVTLDNEDAAPVGTEVEHARVETHGALREVDALAAHPCTEPLSFGLMDFVSAPWGHSAIGHGCGGAIQPSSGLARQAGNCSGLPREGKLPSRCVVMEFKDLAALSQAARRAAQELGYTRMLSIHPDQIRAIVQAFTPSADEVEQALEILLAAEAADWAPVRHRWFTPAD